jgi:hypothetical protein
LEEERALFTFLPGEHKVVSSIQHAVNCDENMSEGQHRQVFHVSIKKTKQERYVLYNLRNKGPQNDHKSAARHRVNHCQLS